MDLDVVLKSHDCPYIIQCYGAIVTNVGVSIAHHKLFIFMEYHGKFLHKTCSNFVLMFACCLTACTINNKIYSSASETGQVKAKYVLYVCCTQTDVFIAMELMGTCAEKLKKRIQGPIPERILGKMTVAVSRKNLNTHKNCKTCLF